MDGCEAARPGDPVVSFGSTSLVPLCRDVFVDPAAKPGERAQLVHLVAVAWSRVGSAFGTTVSPRPIVVFCESAACVAALGISGVEADDETRVNNGQVEMVTLSGESDSFAQTALMGRLSDPSAPFTIALWIKPARNGGTLVHLSASPQGNGWCTPLLGYGEDGRLVAEVLEDARSRTPYVAVTAPEPLAAGRWTHVAMTWAPNASTRLYIDGAEAARASAGRRS